jgi:hypothetical protein
LDVLLAKFCDEQSDTLQVFVLLHAPFVAVIIPVILFLQQQYVPLDISTSFDVLFARFCVRQKFKSHMFPALHVPLVAVTCPKPSVLQQQIPPSTANSIDVFGAETLCEHQVAVHVDELLH